MEGPSVRPQDRRREAAEEDERRRENDWQRNWAVSRVGVGGHYCTPTAASRPGSWGPGWGGLQNCDAAIMVV